MVERKKMLHGFVNALGVIDANVGAVQAGFAGVHEHGGDVAAGQFGHQRRVGFRSHDGHAIDFAFHHAPDASRHPLGIVIRVPDDDFLAALHRLIFKTLHQFRKKRVGDVGDDQSQHPASSRNQGASVGVGIEVQLFDGLAHARRGAGPYLLGIVDGARNRGG